ncbi:hypothetical protein [Idiomarina xiamenensis]|uniref:Uncharacterized protein n=1 Tax=Idiomarina xiamenensis 10-D-4 TaxID=740709 RepID=K2JK30_9GAMM|nr:hypothetical protein [Idiomarina xiamenensis]EKE83801.1 hypothetical protein A10D4_06631 [Idiomarina xiamenensis 10-D-4]
MVLALTLSLSSACFCYVQASMNGMGAKRWALLGLLMGPFGLPLLQTHKRLSWLKCRQAQAALFFP